MLDGDSMELLMDILKVIAGVNSLDNNLANLIYQNVIILLF